MVFISSVLIALSFMNTCWRYYRTSVDRPLTADQLISQISNIARSYGKLFSRGEYSTVNSKGHTIVISLFADRTKSSLPIEVYVIFDCYLYMTGKSLPFEITEVVCVFQENYILEGAFAEKVSITKDEFQEYHSRVTATDMLHTDVVKRLADAWVSEHFYYRYALELLPDDEFKATLASEWNSWVRSPLNDVGQYAVSHSRDRITGTVSFDVDIIKDGTIRFFDDLDLEEHGAMYAAWGENFDLWVYGENYGLRLFIVDDRKKSMVENAITSLNNTPYAIKKVLEFYESR